MAGLGVTTEVSNKNHRRGYRWSQIERPGRGLGTTGYSATWTNYRRKEPVIIRVTLFREISNMFG